MRKKYLKQTKVGSRLMKRLSVLPWLPRQFCCPRISPRGDQRQTALWSWRQRSRTRTPQLPLEKVEREVWVLAVI